MPLAALLNATCKRTSISATAKENEPLNFKTCVSNLEEVLGQDIESLRVVSDALQVGVLIQHGVVGVQEKVQGVLIQEVHLGRERKKYFLVGMQKPNTQHIV